MASLRTNKKRCKGKYAYGSVKQAKAQKKVTQLEITARAKDARHLEEIEELRAIARNEHESLETMI